MARILVVDDESLIRVLVADVGESLGHEVLTAASIKEGQDLAQRGVDIVLLDVLLPDGDGLAHVETFSQLPGRPDVIIITGHGNADAAEAALRSGAWEYLVKPLRVRDLSKALTQAVQWRNSRDSQSRSLLRHPDIIGKSPALAEALEALREAAASNVNVLITGETGTGKELFASALHANSLRASGPFVTVDCTTLPETLVEAHLFGHARGAFTGADRAREGLLAAADHGTLCMGGVTFQVTDVQKNKGGKYMHSGKLAGGVLKLGDTVQAQVDADRRQAIMRAHSATHLLDAALRKVLGDHVHQAGSLVEPDRLRFDFTHFSALTAEELSQVSAMVNEAVLSGYDVVTEEMPIEQAKQRGAIALFGEKYGDTVRVVDMGKGYSVEFCGGTHLDNTAKVGVFHISSEFSVASGVRRIEATTGRASLAVMNRNQEMLFQAAAVLKAKPGELREKAEQVMSEMKNLNHTLEKFRAREAANEAERFLFAAHEVGGLKVLTATVPDADAGKLRKMGDLLRDKEPSVVGVLAAVSGDKITFLAVCGKEAVKAGVKAGDIVKQVSAIAGGSGGGKPDSAMGGGKDPLMLDNALAMVDNVVSMKLGL